MACTARAGRVELLCSWQACVLKKAQVLMQLLLPPLRLLACCKVALVCLPRLLQLEVTFRLQNVSHNTYMTGAQLLGGRVGVYRVGVCATVCRHGLVVS